MNLESKWRLIRKTLNAAFHPQALKSYIPNFNRKTKLLAEIVQKKSVDGPFDMINLLYAANLDILQGKILMIDDLQLNNYYKLLAFWCYLGFK